MSFRIFYERNKMIKQKIQTFFSVFIAFGLNASFAVTFLKEEKVGFIILAAGLIAGIICLFVSRIRKTVSETALKIQPLAAVVFAASFILSFQPGQMMPAQLFAVLVLTVVCLCQGGEGRKIFKNNMSFVLTVCGAGAFGGAVAFLPYSLLIYPGFVLAALCCRPAQPGRTAQEIWNDIAFPVFMLICSFLVFISASHMDGFSVSLAESAVMVMAGALPVSSRGSGVRLMLMTAVVVVFGCYVFSARNTDSVFSQKNRIQPVAQRIV